jgi:opacity protein-like surface antigen
MHANNAEFRSFELLASHIKQLRDASQKQREKIIGRTGFFSLVSAPFPLAGDIRENTNPGDPMKNQLALALLLVVASTTAFAAEGAGYTYLEAGYAQQNLDLAVADADYKIPELQLAGGFARGSVALNDAFHVFGGYRQGSDELDVYLRNNKIGEIDVDLSQYELGLGYHHALSERLDWTGELSYLRTNVDTADEDLSDGGDARASLGLRGDLTRNFEGWAKLNYTDGDFYDGEVSATIGAQIKFNPMWGIVGEADLGSHNRQYSIGVRANF